MRRAPPIARPADAADLGDWVEQYAGAYYAKARDDFGLFRQLIHPEMLWGWWTDEVARTLNRFYRDLTEGRRPKLALMAPPQHGKSWTAWDFIAWIAGKHPDMKTIFASYSNQLGTAANRYLFRMFKYNDVYHNIFPGLRIVAPGWIAKSNLIEFVDHKGSFHNTTIEGAITGFRLDLGVIDDPVKSRAEANSKLIRDRTWSWFTDDLLTRCSKDAGLLIMMTRWHVDDLLGRCIECFGDDLRVLHYPALAEQTAWHWKKELANEEGRWRYKWQGQLVRKGDALFPEHKPVSFLNEQRKVLPQSSWESLFQQNPIIGGGQLPIEKLKVLTHFDRGEVIASVRYWDKAGTDASQDAAYTAGVLMHKMKDGTYVVGHVARGRWGALEREQKIKAWAQTDRAEFGNYKIVVEQEGGSGGKESAETTIRNLAGFNVVADKVTGSKEVRAEPFAAQVQGNNVRLRAGDWVSNFLDEAETFPNGRHDDQIDAASGAFNHLTLGSTFSFNSGWLDD